MGNPDSRHHWLCALALITVSLLSGRLLWAAEPGEPDFSDDYDRIFQIQVVSPDAGGKAATGSGFQVSADGLIVTNYHVISHFVQAPESYEIRYVNPDRSGGTLELLDFDIISDLALLRHPDPMPGHFRFSHRPVDKGERVHALGNPGDWGILLVSGAANGLVKQQHEPRILFSGSLNPGMSGGPTLDDRARIIGVNVATAGSQLSFLVPAEKALQLIDADRQLEPSGYLAEITRQIKLWQRSRLQPLVDSPWPAERFAGRDLFGAIRHDFRCWGDANDSEEERVVTRISRRCQAGDRLYIDNELSLGQISYTFEHYTPVKLNRFQFARSQGRYLYASNDSTFRHSTNFRCESDFIKADREPPNAAYTQVLTCLRAYKLLPGLYDSVILVQVQQERQAFTARLAVSALESDQIMAINRRFIEDVI